jgi:hypothetical protein
MKSKHLGRALGGAVVAILAVAFMAPFAQAKTPAAGYTQFRGCPTKTEFAESEICLRSTVVGGSVKLGSKTVPIEKPFELRAGTNFNLENVHANSEGGLEVVKQKVPGGVIGLTGLTWLAEVLGSEALTLYAATELVGTPEINLNEITLPIKVHLINSTLGNNCYVGSSSAPIVLHLTTFNKGGLEPEITFDEPTGISHVRHGIYVDNKFAAPAASGCVLTLFGFIPISINGLVNAEAGLPAASGSNEAVQKIETEFVNEERVYPPKGF